MKPQSRLDPQPWMTAPETAAVVRALTAKGSAARFVGGCVRDALLERKVKDVDIATPEVPEAVIALLTNAGLTAIPTGMEHGTVTAVSGGRPFEITTLRRDVETHGRHATVAFTDDWVGDAERRDFTLNAIYADPDGTLYDPTGGLADLRAGRVRFVGDAAKRIEEDYLRILRFFRIYAHYGAPPPDAAALAACGTHAAGIDRLSAERVAHELLRLLAAPDPAAVLELMAAHGVLAHVLPEANDLPRLRRLTAIDGADPVPIRRLAAAVRKTPAGMELLASRLRLSNHDRERLKAMAEANPIGTTMDPAAIRAWLYRVGKDCFRDGAYLRWAEDELGHPQDWKSLLAKADDWRRPVFPIGGDDALAAGIPRGPQIGQALADVEDLWIANDFRSTRRECLAELWEIARRAKAPA